MTKEEIDLVEAYVREAINMETTNVMMLTTIKNTLARDPKAPKYLTIVKLQDKTTGLSAETNFNSLKALREIKQKERQEKLQDKLK